MDRPIERLIEFLNSVQDNFDINKGVQNFAAGCTEDRDYDYLILRWLEIGHTLSDKFLSLVEEKIDPIQYARLTKSLKILERKGHIVHRQVDTCDLGSFLTSKREKWGPTCGYYLTDDYKNSHAPKHEYMASCYKPISLFDN